MKKTFTAHYSHAIPMAGGDSFTFRINEPGNQIKIKSILVDAEVYNVTSDRYVPWNMNQFILCDLEIGNNELFASPFEVTAPGAGSFNTGTNFQITEPSQTAMENLIFFNEAIFTLQVYNTSPTVAHTIRVSIVVEAEIEPLNSVHKLR